MSVNSFRRPRAITLAMWLLAIVGTSSLARGLYLPAKAGLGQVLLHIAWQRTVDNGERHRPWPWAETWPVARLQVPGHRIDQIVLAGAAGESLAWAPGLVAGSAGFAAEAGNVAFAGHRDTHFSFLQHLRRGDEVAISEPEGGRRLYRVEETAVVDETALDVLAPTPWPTLTLLTCYPFDSIAAGGPLRYVVRAVAISRSTDSTV